jgi:natural product precursor
MKKMLLFSEKALKQEEMIAIKGGVGYCNCQCIGSVGAWSGYYSSQGSANNAIWNYCSSGVGACQCN